jgi:hypothetical protein
MMKTRQSPPRAKHPQRCTSPPRSKRFVLRPGQRLVTPTVIVTARQLTSGGTGVTTTVSCECTKAEPNKPDCKPVVKSSGSTITVTCKKSGGCQTCKQTTTTSGIFMA